MNACPHCRMPLADAPDLAGQFVACPSCGKSFPMPPTANVPQGVPVADPFVIRSSPGRQPERRRSEPSAALIVAAIVGFLAVAYGGACIIINARRPSFIVAFWKYVGVDSFAAVGFAIVGFGLIALYAINRK